jgi:fucose permease
MAVAGGAVLPLIYGRLAQSYTTQSAYALLIPLYIIILFFACFGYRVGGKRKG